MPKALSRRSFLVGATALGGAFALAACAPKAEPTQAPAPKATQPPAQQPTQPPAAQPTAAPPKAATQVTDVRWISWWGAYNTGVWPNLSKDFKDAFPNINATLEEVPYAEAQTKYQTTLVAGTAADILYHDNYMSQYYTQNLIAVLDDYYDRDGIDYWDDFYHGLGVDDWGGKIYGFPQLFEVCINLINETLIKEKWGKALWEAFPDGVWDNNDYVEMSKAVTTPSTGSGSLGTWGMYIYHRSYYYGYETQGWTRGDSIFDVPNMKFNFTSPIIQQTSHDLFDWVRKDKICISQEDMTEVNKASGAANGFFAGAIGCYNRMTPDIGSGIQSIGDKFEWDIFYLPNSTDGKQGITRAGGHGNNITTNSKVKDAAWELIKFMGTEPGMKYLAETKLAVPGYRKDPSSRAVFMKSDVVKHMDVVYGILENRGGYGDHLRFHNEGEVRGLFQKELDLLYNEPYESAKPKLNESMARVEKLMNDTIQYGDELPFKDIKFPFPPPPPVK